MKKKKILFVYSSLKRGGAEHALVRIASYYSENEYEVLVYLTSPVTDDQSYPLSKGIEVIKTKYNNKRGINKYINNVIELRKIVKKQKPDFVVSFCSTGAVHIVLSTILIRVKKIATERSNPYESMKGTIWFHLKKLFSLFMDGYVFQTERAAMFYPRKVQRIMTVIQNPIEAIPENNYNIDSHIILAVGNLRKVKGYDVLLNAFSKTNKPYILTICGDGECREELKKNIIELGIEDRVSLVGRVSNVSEYYSKAGLFVLSSYHEGMPNALMEAMSFGLPCISTDCRMGPSELIRDGYNGLLVPVGNSEKMTNAIQRLIQNRELRKNMSNNAFLINKTNSMQNIGKMWVNYTNGLLNEK